jgi:HAD superfamily hydrolase (TIGR01549 family)
VAHQSEDRRESVTANTLPLLATYLRARLGEPPQRLLAVTFDVDDTLVNTRATLAHAVTIGSKLVAAKTHVSADAISEAYHHAFDTCWAQPDAAIGRDIHDLRRSIWRTALRAVGASLDETELNDLVETCTAAQVAMFKPDPELRGLLRALAERVPLAVCSNSPAASIHAKLTRAGLAESITAVICAPEAGVAKPDPRLFHLSCQALGAAPERCLHLGDTWDTDIHGAHQAGLAPIWITQQPADSTPAPLPVPRYPTANLAIRDLLQLLPPALGTTAHQPSQGTTAVPRRRLVVRLNGPER